MRPAILARSLPPNHEARIVAGCCLIVFSTASKRRAKKNAAWRGVIRHAAWVNGYGNRG